MVNCFRTMFTFKKKSDKNASAEKRDEGSMPPPAPPEKDLVERFDALALSRGREYFPGGFSTPAKSPPVEPRDAIAYDDSHEQDPKPSDQRRNMFLNVGPLPHPPALLPGPAAPPDRREARPMSLAMQYALSTPPKYISPTYQLDVPRPEPPISLTPPARLHSAEPLGDTISAARPRARSTSPSPASTSAKSKNGSDTIRCASKTQKGVQCSRLVKVPPPLALMDPDAERFCFQHRKEIQDPSGFYSMNDKSEFIKFEDWIPNYLHPDTQTALRFEMQKPRSDADKPGYIYGFEIRDPDKSATIQIKVGRTVGLVTRMDQWKSQCRSKEQVLRGWWPGEGDKVSTMKAQLKPGDPGPLCHRLERLVHLELADLVLYTPYLKSHLSKAAPATDDASPSKGKKAKMPERKPCEDCGTLHKEIFTFKRPTSGLYKGKEWELLVKPVIEKWGSFVEHYVADQLPA